MTWQGYWLPHLIDWILGGAATTVVGLVLRRVLRQLRDAQLAAVKAATSGAQHAHVAAWQAAQANTSSSDVLQRLAGLEGAVEGMKGAVSASLGHRARDALRFHEIEQQLQQQRQGAGRHAAGDDT